MTLPTIPTRAALESEVLSASDYIHEVITAEDAAYHDRPCHSLLLAQDAVAEALKLPGLDPATKTDLDEADRLLGHAIDHLLHAIATLDQIEQREGF